MLRLDENTFETNTIIDLVVLPGMPVHAIVSKLAEGAGHMIVLDTQGDLYFEHGGASWMDEEEAPSEPASSSGLLVQRVDYCFTVSLSDLFNRLEDAKKHKDFILVIDSVTFVCDRFPGAIRPLSTVLWSMIYRCNATVITVNHYRVGRVGSVHGLIPRMGKFWSHTVSYQLLFRHNSCGMEFTVSSRPVEEL